jgi:GntR family transcriptional regulator/MocR family aminotransferase
MQNFPLESIILSREGPETLRRQLYEELRRLITERVLPAGSALPSTRLLAQDLEIARNTVNFAYDQLTAEGYVQARHRATPIIVNLPMAPTTEPDRTQPASSRLSARGEIMLRQPVHHGVPGQLAFHPGMPDPETFPFSTWGRLMAKHARFSRASLFGTYHVAGLPALRNAIANYVKASRGVRCSPEQIVVTTGAQAGLDLLSRLLLDPGETVWMEEPGYYGAQAAFTAAGALLHPMQVTERGWFLDPPPTARLAYVTPSCHHPLGATMLMEQRLRLLEIAEALDCWIIEDDFDGEYRFEGEPIPAMQAQDKSNRVIYVGTFAKILFPALRLGFMVLPAGFPIGISKAISITGQFAPLVLQAALAEFIEQGHMARHLRRMRRQYASRRQKFRNLCEEHLSDWLEIVPNSSGIQMVGILRHDIDDRILADEARKLGLGISPLSIQYRHGTVRMGIVMGYAGADEDEMHRGIAMLQKAYQSTMMIDV